MPGGGGHRRAPRRRPTSKSSSGLSEEAERPVQELTSQGRPHGDGACSGGLQRRRSVLEPEVEAADSQGRRRGGGPQQDRQAARLVPVEADRVVGRAVLSVATDPPLGATPL